MGTVDEFAPLATVEAGRVGDAWTTSGLRSVVLRDDDATAESLLGQAAEHDVVHIASHGLFRDDSPEFSAIRLTDRWVTAAEVSRLRLDGQLIVLSACDTGRRHSSGPLREVVGLPRALLSAGARGVVASRWPADDAATTTLMSALHHGLARGDSDAEALRQAQLATRATHPHPYHWASTMLVGGTS
jgi:CHAT domain-containing protein